MTDLPYLHACGAAAQLATGELAKVERSAAALRTRLDAHFGDRLLRQESFGSSVRQTNLPRRLDSRSDIDHMVVFADAGKEPQTYLDRLRTFADLHYPRSAVRQAHPTIALELDHIQFDLVPAVDTFFGGLKIPDRLGRWRPTSPGDLASKVERRDRSCDGLLKPAIRLAKVWNARIGRAYPSFEFEQAIVERYYPDCETLTDYVLAIFARLPDLPGAAGAAGEEVKRARLRAMAARMFLEGGAVILAEEQFKALLGLELDGSPEHLNP